MNEGSINKFDVTGQRIGSVKPTGQQAGTVKPTTTTNVIKPPAPGGSGKPAK